MSADIPASEIKVGEFRLILAWPFIMPADWGNCVPKSEDRWFNQCVELLKSTDSKWEEKRPSDLMQDGETGKYEEAILLHDYISDTLFNDNPDHIRTFQRSSLRKMKFKIKKSNNGRIANYTFNVPFNSLHVYNCGVVILTIELQSTRPDLTLADAQILTHRLRRANPPFWSKSGLPEYCPHGVSLYEEIHEIEDSSVKENKFDLGDLKNRESAQKALENTKFLQPLFSWWHEMLAPLKVQGDQNYEGSSMLRQIMDERIPLLTTIRLTDDGDKSLDDNQIPMDILHAVSDLDWLRIAEASEEGIAVSGGSPSFRDVNLVEHIHDQYTPFPIDSHYAAGRLIFAYHNFSAVVSDSSHELNIPELVRRHYRHLHHLCLLELATVLRISQRLYQYVKDRKLKKIQDSDSDANFRKKVRDMQEAFMDYTHRHYFTGVSNDLQTRKMFTAFRRSMELDKIRLEIKIEIDSGADLALAEEQMATAKSTHQLTEIATVATVILVAAALSESVNANFSGCRDCINLLSQVMPARISEWLGGWSFDGVSFGLWLLVTSIGSSLLFWKRLCINRNLRRYIIWTILFALSILSISVLTCCPFLYQLAP